MFMSWTFYCETCGFTAEADQPHWRCPDCCSELEIKGLESLDTAGPADGTGLWRYASALPIAAPLAGTILGEGATPLVPLQIDGQTAYLKMDSHLPSGSFKDRGAAVLALYLNATGIRRITVDSSGNAAAAMAAYSAALGLDCTVYVPASASPGKLAQARAYGAEVIPVEGSRGDVAIAAQTAAKDDPSTSYASHNWHPVFVEGVKTWALEVYEQLDCQVPDVAFVPTGGGSALVGAWRGFGDLERALPRLVACQPEACAPVVRALENRAPIEPVEQGDTIAEGTKIAMPSRPRQITKALAESDGMAMSVSDDALIETLRWLWEQGVYVEPTAALGVAACRAAIADGRIGRDQTVVVHITGHGLKATSLVESMVG